MPFPQILPSRFTFSRYPRWGDVYWIDFGAPRSGQASIVDPHPSVVVSNSDVIRRGTVLIIPISGAEHQVANYEFHVVVTRRECPKLDKDSIVKVDQIYCVNYRKELPDQYYLTSFSKQVMQRIYEKLVYVLGFDKMETPPIN